MFCEQHPTWRAVAVSHRGHGDSPASGYRISENTVPACADDLDMLLKHLDIQPTIICGHSFGGKVAMEYLHQQMILAQKSASSSSSPLPPYTWVLDALPGLFDKDANIGHESVGQVLSLLKKVPNPFPSRDFLIKFLTSHGISLPIAHWLTTNARQVNEGNLGAGCTWAIDIDVIHDLFDDFSGRDYWPFLEGGGGHDGHHHQQHHHQKTPGGHHSPQPIVHFIRAGRNPVWTQGDVTRFEKLASSSASSSSHHHNPLDVRLSTMPNVGHWLHTEDTKGVLEVMRQSFIHASASR